MLNDEIIKKIYHLKKFTEVKKIGIKNEEG
jgi:hypothetical protein